MRGERKEGREKIGETGNKGRQKNMKRGKMKWGKRGSEEEKKKVK